MTKVLIVEDNDMLNTAYTFMLKAKGYDVASAFDGLDGLAKAASFGPDIILLDYLMPNLDGRGFLERYQQATDHPDVKIVLLTNLSDDEKIQEARQLGVHTYLMKSQVEPHQLVGVIEGL
jgi:CheY-like chemotaxis protein